MDTHIEGPWTFGDDEGIPEIQGQRNDLIAVRQLIEEGALLPGNEIANAIMTNMFTYYRINRL